MRQRLHILAMGLCLLFMCTEPSTAWQRHTPGHLVVARARKGGALAAGERLLELVFQPLMPSHDSPFRLERAHVRVQSEFVAPKSPPSCLCGWDCAAGLSILSERRTQQ